MSLLCCALVAFAQDKKKQIKIDGVRYEVISETEALARQAGGNLKEVVIKEKVKINKKEYTVTLINDGAFQDLPSLTNVVIPNTVTTIGDRAFLRCKSLISVIIPNTVTSIGNSVFSGCTSLINVEIPNSVTSIGRNAFDNCTSLTSVIIPNSVCSIGEMAFYNCI